MIGNVPVVNEAINYTSGVISHAGKEDAFVYANFGSAQYSHPCQAWRQSGAWDAIGCMQFAIEEARAFVHASIVRDEQSTQSLDDTPTAIPLPSLSQMLDWFLHNKMNAVITLGRSGAVAVFPRTYPESEDEVFFSWPSPPQGKSIDPTGAGDAFGAGFVSSVVNVQARGRPPLATERDCREALSVGTALGSKACEGPGGGGGCPSKGALVGVLQDVDWTTTEVRPIRKAQELLFALDAER
jgi:hypothetical protein